MTMFPAARRFARQDRLRCVRYLSFPGVL